MRGKRRNIDIIVPLVLFLILLSVRLFFSFQTPYLSDESYQHLVKAENPFEEGALFANSFFYYVLAGLLLISKNVLVLKVFSNIFFVLASLMVYFIALRLSKDRFFSFVSALISGFLPVFFSETFNSLTPFTFGLFLLLFNIYAYMNANKKSWLVVYIISFIIFSFTHWLVILFILGLAAYHLILRLELIKQKPYEVELSLFSIFFGLWAQILVCKGLFISHGLSTFSLNIPAVLLSDYFQSHSIHVVISFLGVIPLLVGLYVIYKYLFEKKRKDILLVISIIVVVAVLFLLDVILTDFSLILLGLFFCILFARGISDFKIFIKTTKWAKLLNFFVVLVIILLLVMVVPLTVYHSVFKLRAGQQSDKTIEAILWLKNNSPEDAVILTLPEEGGFVEYFSGRKCVINEDFLSFLDAEERLDDVYRMYETRFETEAIGLLNKYKVSYILFSGSAKEKFNIDRLAFADTKCFDKIYSDDVMIYTKNPGCRLRVI